MVLHKTKVLACLFITNSDNYLPVPQKKEEKKKDYIGLAIFLWPTWLNLRALVCASVTLVLVRQKMST